MAEHDGGKEAWVTRADRKMNYAECVNYIEDIPRFTKKTSLAHTRRLLDELGTLYENRAQYIGTMKNSSQTDAIGIIVDLIEECAL